MRLEGATPSFDDPLPLFPGTLGSVDAGPDGGYDAKGYSEEVKQSRKEKRHDMAVITPRVIRCFGLRALTNFSPVTRRRRQAVSSHLEEPRRTIHR